jgi:protein-L-isoaspartate(D-aspartate) O-methyltransferase
MDKNDLNNHLAENSNVLRTEVIKKAFETVDRADFVDDDYKPEAYEDYALPLAAGQTITKPTLAAFMLELLDCRPGDSVLEVGSGSGWIVALISEIVGKEGKVTGIEIVPELVKEGKENLAKYDFAHATIEQAGVSLGSEAHGPYDKILCTSTADEIPDELIMQLKEGGTIVMPVNGMIVRGVKKGAQLKEEKFPGTFHFEKLSN